MLTGNKKTKYLLGLTGLLMITVTCAAFSLTGTDDFDLARQQILLRKIGHEVLLRSGDSTSRVLPVIKTAENEYQIRFENEFTFEPDSLVKTISRTLSTNNQSDNYVVNVLNCPGKDVIFGYAISGNAKDDIISCSGRKQPKGCYTIDIKFKSESITTAQKGSLVCGISLLAFIGFIIIRPFKTRRVIINTAADEGHYQIGQTKFDPKKRQLINAQTTTELTVKENKLLLIFADSPNVIIERARLQKEIWEDEGVIVGRSLDMFISKLRKKLEHDPSVQLINIHGKGYKLTF